MRIIFLHNEEEVRLVLDVQEREKPQDPNDVVKYHRTVVTHLSALIDAGFTITTFSEPQPTQEMLETHPDIRDETLRPRFLLIAAVQKGKEGQPKRKRKWQRTAELKPFPLPARGKDCQNRE